MFNRSLIIAIKDNPPHAFESIMSAYDVVDEVVVGNLGMDVRLQEKLSALDKVQLIDFPPVTFIEEIRSQLVAKTQSDFILYLDPDELFPKKVVQHINMFQKEADFVSIPRKNIFFGKWMEHARWWPDYQVRFFNKRFVTWKPILHAQPIARGKEVVLEPLEENAITHFNYASVDEYMSKAMRYAKAEARELLSLKKPSYSLHVAIRLALSEFTSRFFAGKGYLDGTHGFVLSVLQMFYSLLVYFYYWEFKKYPESTREELFHATDNLFAQGTAEVSHWMVSLNLLTGMNALKRKLLSKLHKLLKE